MDARVGDGARLEFRAEFDAVFSNAMLHWIRDPDAVIEGVWRALKPGGRFVGEMGGAGNVEHIKNALIAALDAGTRAHVRSELGHHLREYQGRTLLVTHDPLDAMVLADRLVILEGGHVVQQGAPSQVARQPRTPYVAQLVGLNLRRGVADGNRVRLDGGGHLIIAEPAVGPVHLAFPPSAVGLFPSEPAGSPRNTWPVTVAGLERHAHTVRVRLDGSPPVLADVTTAVVAELHLEPGARLWATLKATEIQTYPAG